MKLGSLLDLCAGGHSVKYLKSVFPVPIDERSTAIIVSF